MRGLLILWGLMSTGVAQPTPAPEPAKSPETALQIAPIPADSDEPLYAAPTRLDRIGRILAPVLINGQGPFRFIVDTGANYSVVARRVSDALQLGTGSTASLVLNGVTGSATVPTVFVDRLQVGDLTLEGRQLPVLEYVLANADGILGVEGFEDKRITVDFQHDRITIAQSRGQRPGSNFYKVPAKLRFGRLLVVDVTIGTIHAKGVIDTGSEATLGNAALARIMGVRIDPKRPTQVYGATAHTAEGVSVNVPEIGMGETRITNASVTFGELYVFKLWELEKQPAVLIGMDVLGRLSVLVIDYRRRELQMRLTREP